jgi:membrane-associated protein
MELITFLMDFVLHVDVHLQEIIRDFGLWTYLILFAIIFCETGLVVTPFLPGDSLLFAAGSFAALGVLDPWLLSALLIVAAVAGDTVNYWVGHRIGPQIFHRETRRLIKKEYLFRTQLFYQRHGGKTIVLARFVPIIRTFAPFVAGIGRMHYGRFLAYNLAGGVAWIAIFVWAGYLFGNLPFVRKRFTLVILAIILISVMPMVVEFLRYRFRARTAAPVPPGR